MNRLSIQISPAEAKVKDKAKAKAIMQGTTLRAIIIKALEAYCSN